MTLHQIYIYDLYTSIGPGNYSSYTATLYFFLYSSGQSRNGTTCTQYIEIKIGVCLWSDGERTTSIS